MATRFPFVSLLTALLMSPAVFAGDRTAGPVTVAGGTGLIAYLDPFTGKLVDHPPATKSVLQLNAHELNMFSTDDFGLIEHRLPDGSYAVDLQGRFRQGVMATLNSSGKVRIHQVGGEMFNSPAGRRVKAKMRQRSMERADNGEPE